MRILLITFCVFFLIASLVLTDFSYAEVDPGAIVGVWLFDEVSGAVAVDSSGNGNDGILTGGVERVDGKFGDALEFNGSDSFIDTRQKLLEAVEEFTIVLWVQKGNIVASRIGLVGQNDTVEFGFIAPTTVQVWSEGAGTSADVNYPHPVGEWHHVAATGNTKSLKNYLDGVLGRETGINVPNHGSSGFNVNIGGGGIFDGSGNWYTGVIDEVAIFNVALEESDINKIMDEGLAQVLGLTPVSPAGSSAVTWGGIKSAY